MMSQPPLPSTPQANAKRYWGEEKNLDSIYSIYLKKICYSTHNNDLMSKNNVVDRRNSQDSRTSSTASSSDLARFAAQASNDSSCQKETPRGRKNFFQKYRRRSCSMDKYSFDKYHKGGTVNNNNNTTPTSQSCSKKDSKTMRYSSASKNKQISQLLRDDRLDHSHDECDSSHHLMNDSNYSSQALGAINGLQKSMNDISSMQVPAQSLQWETRQIKILQAATLDHVLKFILLINSSSSSSTSSTSSRDPANHVNSSDSSSSTGGGSDSTLEEERNNVAHIIHVFFCTFRTHTNPYELMLKLMDYSDICRVEQYRFVMHYWMDNYPEDFEYIVEFPENCEPPNNGTHNKDHSISNASATTTTTTSHSINSHHSNSIASYDSSITTKTVATTSDSETNSIGAGNGRLVVGGVARAATSLSSRSAGSDQLDRRLSNLSIRTNTETPDHSKPPGVTLLSELLRLCRDEYIRKKASQLDAINNNISNSSSSSNIIGLDSETTSRRVKQSGSTSASSKNSAILDLDSRYVAQQLTAIDLDNFLNLRPYSLLEGTRSDKRVQSMVKNFNLLSRHVVVTILKSHQPNIVAAHWIAIAMNLRKIKNFNSLKAIIAGLTNESVYRLKQLVWSKLDRTSSANFKLMASIVDDVNNQIVLRQTQLIVEGTAKMSIEDDSFGTIPYLGTFLTDLNMIDARYPSYVPSPKDETSKLKLINFEKCAKQFEILTQVQLLQKNVLASLHAIQRRNHFDEQTTLNRLKLEFNQNRQVFSNKPAIPKVARLFENWFYDNTVASMTDKQCYEISVSLEQNVISR